MFWLESHWDLKDAWDLQGIHFGGILLCSQGGSEHRVCFCPTQDEQYKLYNMKFININSGRES